GSSFSSPAMTSPCASTAAPRSRASPSCWRVSRRRARCRSSPSASRSRRCSCTARARSGAVGSGIKRPGPAPTPCRRCRASSTTRRAGRCPSRRSRRARPRASPGSTECGSARLKFGLYSSIANPPRGENLDRSIDEVIAEAQLAEACGFDSCFFGEHHQDKDGFLPSPIIAAAVVAARTSRLRVGTSVLLLPLHHPVRVAEDAITLDLASKGRVILGVGIGYQAADFQAFAVPMEHRLALFEEGVEILRRCWAGEPFSFRGKHYTLEDVQIRP